MSDSGRNEAATSTVAVLSVAALFVGWWYGVIAWFDLPKILLPSPHQVAISMWQNREVLAAGTLTTAMTAAISLIVTIVLGSFIAIVFSQSKWLRRAFFPYVVFLQTVPIVAIAPLLIIWFGYEFRTTVIATVIICLFPIVNNVTTGLESARMEHRELFQLYRVNRFQMLYRLQIPTAVPYLLSGTRISSGLAVIGAIVAELFVSNGSSYEGLGALMQKWQGLMKTDALMAALLLSTLLGLALFGLVQGLGRVLLKRFLMPQ